MTAEALQDVGPLVEFDDVRKEAVQVGFVTTVPKGTRRTLHAAKAKEGPKRVPLSL